MREKMVKMSQATFASTATPVAATILEAETRVLLAEERARESEREFGKGHS